MRINKSIKIFVVRPNTRHDPLRVTFSKPFCYDPLMVLELLPSTGFYKVNGLDCFDVVGDHGTKNKGLTDGTRRVYAVDIGIVKDDERKHMACGGLTRAFDDEELKNKYVLELNSEENKFATMSTALGLWGFNTEEVNVNAFLAMNESAALIKRDESVLFSSE